MDLYTVDRLGTLASGMECGLVEHHDISPQAIADLIKEFCPGGVSRHGDLYLASKPTSDTVTDANTEMLFELIRQAKYPDRPSRYQSIFAVDNLDSARRFAATYGNHQCNIYGLNSAGAFRADMGLLDARVSAAVKVWFANRYWQGLPHPEVQPFWEYIVPCPVVIGAPV